MYRCCRGNPRFWNLPPRAERGRFTFNSFPAIYAFSYSTSWQNVSRLLARGAGGARSADEDTLKRTNGVPIFSKSCELLPPSLPPLPLQSAIFSFQSLLVVILLLICTCTYIHSLFPRILDANKTGYRMHVLSYSVTSYNGHYKERTALYRLLTSGVNRLVSKDYVPLRSKANVRGSRTIKHNTVEPPNKGHYGANSFVHFGEVAPIAEVK